MTGPVAFYAPLKSPDHPSPSGDRTMARLLMQALKQAGFAPHLASTLRSFEPVGDRAHQEAIRADAGAEVDRIVGLCRSGALPRPRLWFTYHCYYKAPDWIGPAVSRALRIPYVVAEGSRARKRESGPWAVGHEGATAALDAAAVLFAMTDQDRPSLLRDRVPGQAIVALPPFLDLAAWPEPHLGGARRGGPARLLAVAMMREGDKLASLRELADALSRLPRDANWHLTVAGDGPARPAVVDAFARFGTRVALTPGALDRPELARLYDERDLLVWPAINEAYGMALLEAQAMGCPVLAVRRGGVASVVRDGETGFLVGPEDPAAFAETLARLLGNLASLRPLRPRARAFVAGERDLPGAASILRTALHPLLDAERAA